MTVRQAVASAAWLALILAAPLAAQEPAPTKPSPATVAMRWQWLNPEINSFTFRDTDAVFESRPVARSGPVWELPRREGFVRRRPAPTASRRATTHLPRRRGPMRCW